MNLIKRLPVTTKRGVLPSFQPRAGVSLRISDKLKEPVKEDTRFPSKIFSGIQPTGLIHLGNYLGAIKKWQQLQNSREDITLSIVDMHSITTAQDPVALRENIFHIAATMLACGIDPDLSTIFVQSAVKEHAELSWILGCMCTMARLGHLPQYKEKTRVLKDIPLGIFVYPVLQAADILLYKATHVPVGEDQVQHIQLAQHLAKTFNTKYGVTFPICHAMLVSKDGSRVRSLRDPSKKMSKSDTDLRATINLMDEPEVIVEKLKKAITDFTSDVSYDIKARPGVSNLISIHHLVTGKSIESICEEAKTLDTGKYKLRVADAVVEHLKPIRMKIKQHLTNRNELIYLLEIGAEKARQLASETMSEIKTKIGLGADYVMPPPLESRTEETIEREVKVKVTNPKVDPKDSRPVVPIQPLRVEKKRSMTFDIKIDSVAKKTVESKDEMKMSEEKVSNTKLGAKKDVSSSLVPKTEAVSEKIPKDLKI